MYAIRKSRLGGLTMETETMLDAILFCYSDEFENKLKEENFEKSIPCTHKITHMSREKMIKRHRVSRKKAVKSNQERLKPKYHRVKMPYGDPYGIHARRKIEEKFSISRGLTDYFEELEDYISIGFTDYSKGLKDDHTENLQS